MRWRVALAWIVLQAPLSRAEDWPQLLGPWNNGSAEASNLATAFADRKPPVLWSARAGFGSAPAVIAGGKVYVIGLFKPGSDTKALGEPEATPTLDEITAGAFPSSDLPGTPERIPKTDYPSAFRGDLYAQCLDAATGKRLWATKLTEFGLAFKTNKHGGTGWEVASPLVVRGQLFVHTHTGHLYCLDAEAGKLKWDRNLFEHRMSTWFGGQQGNSSAPLGVGDYVLVSYDIDGCLGVGAFDAATGAERWTAKAPKAGANTRSARISVGAPGGQATVLCSCGSGTLGLDPETGKLRWWFDFIEANPDTMKKVPADFAANEKSAKDYKVDALRSPYPGFCPLVWQDHVIDAACVGHNSITSATWCLKIEGGQATRVWQTHDFVPTSASLKSSMAVREGKLFGFDSYFPGFARTYRVTRPYRGEKIGEFQCRDVATGKLLWSSDSFNPAPAGAERADSANASLIVTASALIVTNNSGLWIAQLRSDGAKVTVRIPQAAGKLGRMLGEPALAGGRLFVRQLDTAANAGLIPALDVAGNLFCLDVRSR